MVILTGSFSCSAFLVVPEYIDTHPPAEPSDLQRKDHPWKFSAAVAHNFQILSTNTISVD